MSVSLSKRPPAALTVYVPCGAGFMSDGPDGTWLHWTAEGAVSFSPSGVFCSLRPDVYALRAHSGSWSVFFTEDGSALASGLSALEAHEILSHV